MTTVETEVEIAILVTRETADRLDRALRAILADDARFLKSNPSLDEMTRKAIFRLIVLGENLTAEKKRCRSSF